MKKILKVVAMFLFLPFCFVCYFAVGALDDDYAYKGYYTFNDKVIANICRTFGKNDKAIDNYTRVIKLNPNECWAYRSRGLLYFKSKEYDKAVDDFTQHIELIPKPGSSSCSWSVSGIKEEYLERLDVYYLQINDVKRRKRVTSLINKFKQSKKEHSRAYNTSREFYNRGLLYYRLKEYDKAIDNYNAAIKLNPDCCRAFCKSAYAIAN